ncbi:uncharacterized protein LOC112323659 [Populus trichocarpa]|uniref:uncharacterized protein LOC112323659 n=1 Tax=Populus trichocarpa TaxID=3694 RepID=UPI0022798993|nr:uncharacterized protein LOC112323659 [Populus trichocarpa]
MVDCKNWMGEAAVAGEGERPNQTEGVPPVAAEQQERSEAQPSTIPTGVLPQYVDAGLLVQIVKAVMEGMTGSATQTTPTTQIPQAAPMTSMTTDNVVPLVRLVKSMREMGCEPYMREQDAEITGRWIRKVEKTMIQISIPEGLRVNCATQLLSDRAMTWWETVQLRHATETLTWSDFKTEFENQFYSRYHRKVKEQEFLALRQGDMSVSEYERRFHDLSLFTPHYVPTEEHMIEKLRDGLRQDLRQGLIALRFKSVRELIEAAQALEACIGESQGGHQGIGKKRDGDYFSGRPPLPKKGKSGVFEQYRKKGSLMLPPHQQSSGRVMVGQSHSRENSSTGTGDCKGVDYPFCHFKRDCPKRNTGQVQSYRQPSQSHQQSVTVNRPVRSSQSGANSSRGRPRAQNDRTPGRVFHLTQEEVRAASDVVAGTLLLNDFNMHVLFYPGTTHSFIAKRIVIKLRKGVEIVEKGFLIGTPMGNMVETNIVYVDVGVSLSGYETEVDLIPLELHDFDIILGMNWLSKYKARIDCYAKTVTFQTPKGERMIFKGERILKPIALISVVTAQKLLRKGCMGYLTYILNFDDEGPRLKDIPVVKEFPDVFPKELPGLPPKREVEVSIDTFPGVPPIAQQPYRVAPAELNELKTQLQELLDKGYIRPSNSPWGAPVLFVR